MRILVIGGGGREHAIGWRLAQSGHQVLSAPGNPGLEAVGSCHATSVSDLDGIVALAKSEKVDLVVVGPEAPLVAGLADRLREAGVPTFGPAAAAAQLEGSKAFSKQFFARHGIRSAAFRVCETVEQVKDALGELEGNVVVKADGLAAGKGVVVCDSAEEAIAAARDMLEERRFGDAGERVVVEERLSGQELSVMALTDGVRLQILAQAEDHKAVFDGDRGPNTGGMGTVSPAAWATPELIARVEEEILKPTLAGLAADHLPFCGVLYAGLMVAADGTPWLLEYNCRFGDPETQPVLARLKSDLGEYLLGAARGELPEKPLEWDERTAVCVVMASAGYPESPKKGDVITGVDTAGAADDVIVFHAGTKRAGDRLVTAGGRVLGVTALAADTDQARNKAYAAVDAIAFDGAHYRSDIGARR